MTDAHAELDLVLQHYPVAQGRIAKELLQRVLAEIDQTSRLVEERAGRSRIARLVGAVGKRGREEQAKVERDLVGHQRELALRVDSLLRHGMAVDADVAVIAGHLRRTQYVAAHAEHSVRRAQAGLADLAEAVAALADYAADLETKLQGRIDTLDLAMVRLERRVTTLEVKNASDRSLKASLRTWQSGATYPGLPWTCRVTLLAQEVFTGPCGHYEQLTADTAYRRNLVEAVLDTGSVSWSERRSVAEILAETADDIGSGDLAILVAELLGAGLEPPLDVRRGPVVSRLRDHLTGERTDMPSSWAPSRLTGAGFLHQVVNEQADTALQARRAASPLAERATAQGTEHGSGPS